MKIRSGFVSNSSSSSFIIAIAKIDDPNQAATMMNGVSEWSVKTMAAKDISSNGGYDVSLSGSSAVVESFTGDTVQVDNLKDDDYIAILSFANGDDSDFWNEEYGEMNYDIVDLSFFPKNVVSLALAMQDGTNGFSRGQMTYGAGRNG